MHARKSDFFNAMLSRRHIRVKVMQLLFAQRYDPREVMAEPVAEKRIAQSMNEVYSAYLYMLDYARQLMQFARQLDQDQAQRYLKDETLLRANAKLYENPLFERLEDNSALEKALEQYQARFRGDRDLLRKIFQELRNNDEYAAYLRLDDDTRLLHMDMIYYLINHFGRDYALFAQHLEEEFPNWQDDRRLVMKMVRKTLRTLVYEKEKTRNILEPIAAEPQAIREFGTRLYIKNIAHQPDFASMLRSKMTHTDADAVPIVDHILMEMGVSEFLHFPTIPVSATINEYVDIAKVYSLPSSKKMVNAVLQSAYDELNQSGRIYKTERPKPS